MVDRWGGRGMRDRTDWRVEGDGYDDRMYEMCSLRERRDLADEPKGLRPDRVDMMMVTMIIRKKGERREKGNGGRV